MELDQALELSVVSSWKELVKPGESCSLHVEYENVCELPLKSVEVWMVKNRGYGTLVCNYSMSRSDSAAASAEPPRMHFANSYGSKTLAANLDFIMRNQRKFSRPPSLSIHGLIQIDHPSEEEGKSAAIWSRGVRADSPEDLAVEALAGEAVQIHQGTSPEASSQACTTVS